MVEKCGKNVNVEHGAFLASGMDIEIGNNSGIGLNCRITGPLSIGDDVMMAPGVMIFTQNHETSDLSIPMWRQTAPKLKVTIGNDVWIGANAIVVGRIQIGSDVLIAPGAYVNFDVPSHSIVLGNPAKIVAKENATEKYIKKYENITLCFGISSIQNRGIDEVLHRFDVDTSGART